MNSENFNIAATAEGKNLRKIRVLVAPLDWGLGHATRCIPIIHELLRQDCDVWLAGEGAQEILLREEFPHLPFLSLPGYRVKYSRSAAGMILSMFTQSGKILAAIKHENNWLKKAVQEFGFDAIISDNRYGLFHPDIPCIFITHQLRIKSSLGKWTEKFLQKRNYQYINRFKECWVPDVAAKSHMAGELSHPVNKPEVTVYYLGILSRLTRTNEEEIKGHLLVILSGPEPQRSILENKIIKDIAHYPGTATVIRGLPGNKNIIPSTNHIKFYNHLPAEKLNEEMNRAEYVISRSGYSTIMDVVKLKKKSILIPTPGQTEQEYLAAYLQERKIALTFSQKNFALNSALQVARSFIYTNAGIENENALQQVVTAFLHSLSKH